jgi:predicted porin
MNKKLIGLAVAAALAAPMAANAAVTVYGAAHLSVDMFDNGNSSNNDLMTLSSNSSFIGLKADEDLGDGMKAIFGAEWQVGLDNGTTGMANRNVFVGLQGGFGTVKLGQIDDVTKQVGRAVDLFWNEQVGESRTLTRQNTAATLIDWDARMSNGINYENKFGAVTFTLNYGMANDSSETLAEDLTQMAVGLQYSAGPLYIGAAYKTVDVDSGTTTQDSDNIRVTAAYTMGAAKIVAFYQTVSGATSATDRDTMGLGASFTMGKGVLKAQYYMADDLGTTANSGADLIAVGYDYELSKTTAVYVAYATVDNDTGATFSIISAGHGNPTEAGLEATTAGNDPSAISVGMKMKF